MPAPSVELHTGRTVVVGDIHGCSEELKILLDQVDFQGGDQLISVGDAVARGPDSLGVLSLLRQTGAVLVRGNHEARVLSILERKGGPNSKRGSDHAQIAQEIGSADETLLRTSPLHVHLPEHDLSVVHAGIVPDLPMSAQDPALLLNMRTLDGDRPRTSNDGVLWGRVYQGPPHIAFGHNAVVRLQLHAWATGLDTGCVYGGSLTALVLEAGERVREDTLRRQRQLVSVAAKRVYYDPMAPKG